MDWQAITHDAMRSVFSQVNNNLAQQNMAASGMQASIPGFPDGGAPRHIQGLIPGKVNPAVADDTVIKAKRGEYIFPVEVVEALGGPEVLDGIVLGVKNKLGLPAVVGPAVGGIDSQGRHDAKGLQPGMMGAADSGLVGVVKDIGNGLYDAAQKIPGVPEAASAVKGAAEFGFSPMTSIPRSTVSAVSNLIDGRPPDGILGSAFMSMTEAGKNPDATKTGPSSLGAAFPQPVKPSTEPMVPGGAPSAPASTTAPKPKGLPSSSSYAPPAAAPAFNTPLLQVGAGQTPTGYQSPVSISTGNIGGLVEQDVQRGVLSDGVRHNNSYDLARGVQSIMSTASGNDITQSKGISPTAIIRGPLDAAAAKSIRDRVDWSNGSVNANAVRNGMDQYGRTYDEQVAHTQQVNAANALPTMSPKQAAELAIANDTSRSRVTRSNAAQGVAQFNNQMENAKVLLGNQQAQTIAGMKEQGVKSTADAHKYAADQTLAAHKYTADAGVTKATQTALGKQQEQGQKNRSELLKTHRDFVLSKTMPSNFEGQQEDIAKTLTDAADPQNNTGIYYGPGGGARAGIAANKQVMDALVAKWTKAGYQPKDAHARAVGDYASLAAAGKVKAAKPIPYLGVLPTSKIKQPEPER